MKTKVFLFLSTLTLSSAFAYEAQIKKGEMSADFDVLLEKARQETGARFNKSDFQLIEKRDLATSRFSMFVQTNSMIPVARTAVRIWSDLKTGELILAELHLDEKADAEKEKLRAKFLQGKFSPGALKSKQLSLAISELVAEEVQKHPSDKRVLGMKFNDVWDKGDLVREVEVRSRRGVHFISVSLLKNKILKSTYREFPQGDSVTLKANVFPIYEEVEKTGERLNYEERELRHVHSKIYDAGEDPLRGLGDQRFSEDKYNPILAQTMYGEALGLWSEGSIRKKVEALTSKLPIKANDFENGLLLEGKYVTINLHPGVKEAFKEIDFTLKPTVHHMLTWMNNGSGWEAKPTLGFAGKVITSENDLLNRIPFRHPEHNPASYINSGVDEAQVYYAVTVLMESLVDMGFTDKELSEKPFHAFLYDPDIGMKDNAYYYDNTINFTTYNPGSPNMARDNPTIWHEMGHAVMERIMGSYLGFADSKGGYGGLSEGMADFIAQIVVEHETAGADFPGKNDFRIINETGFYLTNEFHDEGEAYGGAMNDMLMTIISYEGRQGLIAFTDLTLEAMRFTRNHPALSAASWFEHMLYADELGSTVRTSGKYREVILNALKARNFSFSKSFRPASMTITFDGKELTNESQGSRENPITYCGQEGVINHDLKLSLRSGDARFINFPAVVKIEYKQGALQGAINWEGESQNPEVYEVKTEDELLNLPLKASMKCEFVNQPDGSCKDYAYIQIFNKGSKKPIAKKRFYLKLFQTDCQ
jgi:hypothetical protein